MPTTSASGWATEPSTIPNPRLKEMKLKLSDALLAASMSICASGLICGAALIHESATGQITGRPERATTLLFSALGLTHAAVLPLELARVTTEQEQA